MNFWDWFALTLSAVGDLMLIVWLAWRLEPTVEAFEGIIEIIADATRF